MAGAWASCNAESRCMMLLAVSWSAKLRTQAAWLRTLCWCMHEELGADIFRSMHVSTVQILNARRKAKRTRKGYAR